MDTDWRWACKAGALTEWTQTGDGHARQERSQSGHRLAMGMQGRSADRVDTDTPGQPRLTMPRRARGGGRTGHAWPC